MICPQGLNRTTNFTRLNAPEQVALVLSALSRAPILMALMLFSALPFSYILLS